ncbi:hypothetical protein, partial [Klebsiella pneumoniae]|uniref:hypothetical protein n=1 Tax=Klebsiella pneumoniae TaxID=573 RepID=UPI001C694868
GFTKLDHPSVRQGFVFIPCFGDRVCGKGWGKPFGGACFGGLKLWLFFAQFSRVILVFILKG